MQSSDESHKVAIFAAIVFVLFGTYVSYAMFLSGQPDTAPGVSTVAAESGSGSDGGDSEDSNDDEDDNDREDAKSEDNDEEDDQDDVSESKTTQTSPRKTSSGSGSRSVSNTQELSETSELGETDTEEDSDNSGEGDSEEGMYKDQAKTKERLTKKLAEAEKEIMEKQAEGVDVTAALAALALAREKASGVDTLFTTNQLAQVKDLTKETERLTHAARGKILHMAKKAAEDMSKVDKRFMQVKRKMAELQAAGGDTSLYQSRLETLETEWAQLKTSIAANGEDKAVLLASVDGFERRVKSLKSAVEAALYALGVSDDEFETEHVAAVKDISDEIADLAEIAGDDEEDANKGLERLASAYSENAERASSLVKQYESRSAGMRQLFGDDRKSLSDLRAVAVENEARITAMERAIATVEDAEVKALLVEELDELRGEQNALVNFIQSRPTTSGLFGWLFNWF